MSENPVRSASVEAAKEIWVLKNTSSVPSEIQSQMADLIESKFASVVAAAEEAMRDKCEAECDVIMQSREEGDAKGISAANLCAMAISLIPTGTALAEHVDRATAELRAENKELADDYQSLGQERERELNSLKAQLAEGSKMSRGGEMYETFFCESCEKRKPIVDEVMLEDCSLCRECFTELKKPDDNCGTDNISY